MGRNDALLMSYMYSFALTVACCPNATRNKNKQNKTKNPVDLAQIFFSLAVMAKASTQKGIDEGNKRRVHE